MKLQKENFHILVEGEPILTGYSKNKKAHLHMQSICWSRSAYVMQTKIAQNQKTNTSERVNVTKTHPGHIPESKLINTIIFY